MAESKVMTLAKQADLLDFRDEEGCVPEGYMAALNEFYRLIKVDTVLMASAIVLNSPSRDAAVDALELYAKEQV